MYVQGKDVVLKISTGTGQETIACNSSCTLTVETDFLESTFLSGKNRKVIPNVINSSLSGNGAIALARPFGVAQIMNLMLSQALITWYFELTDGTTTLYYSGQGYFESVSITGDVDQVATCDYTIQNSGPVAIQGVVPDVNDELVTRFYDVNDSGDLGVIPVGSLVYSSSEWIGSEMILLFIERESYEIITTGVPTAEQVLFDSTAGQLTFGFALAEGMTVQTVFAT